MIAACSPYVHFNVLYTSLVVEIISLQYIIIKLKGISVCVIAVFLMYLKSFGMY